MLNFVKVIAALGLAAVVSGCASFGLLGDDVPTPTTMSQRVLAVEADYYAAFTGMATYEGLPRCSNENAPTICSEQSVVDAMRTVDRRFLEARGVAWDIVRAVNPEASVFENAVSALSAVVDDAVAIVGNLEEEGLI